MLYMIIERFKNRDAKAVYRRFREKGRMAPDGLAYVESWVETNFDRCFQLMECGDVRLLEQWADRWRDLVDFELSRCAVRKKRLNSFQLNSESRLFARALRKSREVLRWTAKSKGSWLRGLLSAQARFRSARRVHFLEAIQLMRTHS